MSLRARALFTTPLLLLAVSACTSNADDDADSGGSGGRARTITVSSTDDACKLSATTAPSGNLVFKVANEGSKVTEFYLLDSDAVGIVSEVENIGPGLTRELVVQVEPGDYVTQCKPGMTGKGIQADFTVTDSGQEVAAPDDAAVLDAAVARYASFVQEEADELLDKTEEFAALYVAGKDQEARDAYAPARMHWERIEPVAESFGDLDPKLDLREADLEDGQAWTGWHAIEKDLWPPVDGSYQPATDAQRNELADQLVADTKDLHGRTQELTYTPAQLGNGAKELLDEVATGKVTGEEEAWSHTDLWDFKANVEGAEEAFEALEPALRAKDPKLADTLEARFDAVDELLERHEDGDGYVLYTTLTAAEVKELATAVDALSEPLSKLTAAVVL